MINTTTVKYIPRKAVIYSIYVYIRFPNNNWVFWCIELLVELFIFPIINLFILINRK